MPTAKKRFSITLDHETYKIYKRYSELAGSPACTVISSLLVEARDHFVQLGVMLQRAKALQGETAEQRAEFMARIDMGMHRAQAAADLIGNDLVQIAEQPLRVAGVAPATPQRAGGKKPSNNLIHTNKPSNPLPARVPAHPTTKKTSKK